jgi:hypothetical protein
LNHVFDHWKCKSNIQWEFVIFHHKDQDVSYVDKLYTLVC